MPQYLQNFVSYIRAVFDGLSRVRNIRLSVLRKVFSLMDAWEKTAFIFLLMVAVTTFTLSLYNGYVAITVPVKAAGGEYREGLLGQPRLINPLLANSNTDSALVAVIFSGLYKYDNNGVLVPDLATALPEVSEDEKSYTIHIKDNVLWHDNRPLGADDVVFTIKSLQDQAYKSPLRNEWLNTTVDKIDDHTVIFTNKVVSAPFLNNLTLPILPKHLWATIDPDNFSLASGNLEAVGSGPYALKEIKKLPSGTIQSITLESYSHYYQGKPLVDTLVFQFYDDTAELINALHSKVVDGFGYIPTSNPIVIDNSRGNFTILQLPLPQYQALFFNTKEGPLTDGAVRKALRAATNKTAVLQSVFGGRGILIDTPLLGSVISNPLQADYFDMVGAAQLLDSAGWIVDSSSGSRIKKGKQLELTIVTNDSPLNMQTASLISKQWGALNVKTTIKSFSTSELTEKAIRPREFDVLVFSQRLGADPDPFAFWHSSQVRDPGLNVTGFSNPDADNLISAARNTTDEATQADKYTKLDAIIRDAVPAVFLNQSVFVYVQSTDVKNVGLTKLIEPAMRFYDLPNWYVSEKRVLKWFVK